MTTFDTPDPISVTIEFGVGNLRIDASDRTDTLVVVGPTDPANPGDIGAAGRTRVEFVGGRLLIAAPKSWRRWTWRGGHESVDVRIDLPSGSDVQGQSDMAVLRCAGRIGDIHYSTGMGDISFEDAGTVNLKTGFGDITVGRAGGRAEITTGSGAARVERVDGPAVVRNGNGGTWIGEVTGDLRAKAANGAIEIGVAHSTVGAKSANGRIEIGEVMSGAVVAQTAMGDVEVGVRDGVAAWLDLHTKFGNVIRDMDEVDQPGLEEGAVEVHARTSYGDITVRRSIALRGRERS